MNAPLPRTADVRPWTWFGLIGWLICGAFLTLGCRASQPKPSAPTPTPTPQALSPGEGMLPVTGGKIWYRIVGSGTATPLVVLHGGPGYPHDYLARLAALANERPVIFYDQLGCGKSERPNDPTLWRMERFVEELKQLRAQLGLSEVHLLGHSWGTMLATDYLLTQPSGVKAVVLASPCLSAPNWAADAQRLLKQLPLAVQQTVARHEKAGTTASPAYQAATQEYFKRFVLRLKPWPPEVEQTLQGFGAPVYTTMWGPSEFTPLGNLKDYDRTERLRELRVPALFTAGRYDEATPETVKAYQRQWHGAEFVLFEQSAHMAMLEETDKYVATVRDFLQRVERR